LFEIPDFHESYHGFLRTRAEEAALNSFKTVKLFNVLQFISHYTERTTVTRGSNRSTLSMVDERDVARVCMGRASPEYISFSGHVLSSRARPTAHAPW
jgi:hypothetical protein